jgi:hypothetical protein
MNHPHKKAAAALPLVRCAFIGGDNPCNRSSVVIVSAFGVAAEFWAVTHERRWGVSEQWFKPDFQEIGVAGECTAYAGTQEAFEANYLSAYREANEKVSGEASLPSPLRDEG